MKKHPPFSLIYIFKTSASPHILLISLGTWTSARGHLDKKDSSGRLQVSRDVSPHTSETASNPNDTSTSSSNTSTTTSNTNTNNNSTLVNADSEINSNSNNNNNNNNNHSPDSPQHVRNNNVQPSPHVLPPFPEPFQPPPELNDFHMRNSMMGRGPPPQPYIPPPYYHHVPPYMPPYMPPHMPPHIPPPHVIQHPGGPPGYMNK